MPNVTAEVWVPGEPDVAFARLPSREIRARIAAFAMACDHVSVLAAAATPVPD